MSPWVGPLSSGGEPEWDAFVAASREGTFFHLSGWRQVIENAFFHRTHYLEARRSGALSAVLPLTEIRSRLFGHMLISNAFCMYGGTLASDDESKTAVESEAARIARDLNVDFLEFRCRRPEHPDWRQAPAIYCDFRRSLPESPDILLKQIPQKRRNLVRKAMKAGLFSVIEEDVETFYGVYAESVRNLGTPVYSKRYFQLLKRQFWNAIEIVTVRQDGAALASAMCFNFKGLVIPYYAGGRAEARGAAANDFLFWEVMRRACGRRSVFDFGRSKIGTGAFQFKLGWGFEPAPIVHEFLPVRSLQLPNLNPLNPKFALAISAWKRLPLFLTKIIGPPIVRQIG